MGDMKARLERILSGVDVDWTAQRMDRSWTAMGRRRRRRAATRAIASASGAAAVLAMLYGLLPSPDAPVVSRPVTPEPPPESGEPGLEKAEVSRGPDRQTGRSSSAGNLPSVNVDRGGARETIVLDVAAVATPAPGGRIEVMTGAPGPIAVRVVDGTSRFQVGENAQRRVEVMAGEVRIMVYASEFSVSQDDLATEIWTHRGAVSVQWRGDTHELHRGQHRRFVRSMDENLSTDPGQELASALERDEKPARKRREERSGVDGGRTVNGRTQDDRTVGAGARKSDEPDSPRAASRVAGDSSSEAAVGPGGEAAVGPGGETAASSQEGGDARLAPSIAQDWRELARSGKFDAARRALQDSPAPGQPADLMLAADVHRMSGHPRAAVDMLSRVVREFPDDRRAALAAFTLGKLSLEELGEAGRAARAFATARSLAPNGPLAEDSLAREVEAWSKAGRDDTARERARLYLERYPDGYRIRAVKQYGRL